MKTGQNRWKVRMKNTMTSKLTGWCLMTAMLALSMLTVSCSSSVESLEDGPSVSDNKQDASNGEVVFGAYLNRPTTRAGVGGTMTLDNLKTGIHAASGFSVIGYYTGAELYTPIHKPNFMYNQQVTYNSGLNIWEYTPLKYWPNMTEAGGGLDDSYVSFFAYAPWVEVAPSTGKVTGDDTKGIISLTRNNMTGDPKVRYMSSLKPSECPASTTEKVNLNFNHALASLNVMVDAYVDGTDATNPPAPETRVWIRSISFEGFTTHGSFKLSNTSADWMEPYSDDPIGNDAITVHDGRTNGLEGQSATGNEKTTGLNSWLIQEYAYGTDLDNAEAAFIAAGHTGKLGVYNDLRNLFGSETNTDPIYVIPTDKPLRVTIAYDIETQAAHLPGYLADGKTHGVKVSNVITATIEKAGGGNLDLTAGKNYTVRLHLGLSSVQCAATVTDWGTPASPKDLDIEMEDLPISQMMLNVYVNPWSDQDEVALNIPMTELSELATYFSGMRTGDDDISGQFVGRDVDKFGNIAGMEGTNYDPLTKVGRIVYISTDGTDVDASRSGSRILVMAEETDFGTDISWDIAAHGLQGFTDVTSLNGYNATQKLKSVYSGTFSTDFPAAYNADNYNSTKPTAVGSGWFLPTKQQMMLIGCNDGTAGGMASTMGLSAGSYWSITEQDATNVRCYVNSQWTVVAKVSAACKIRPMFAY